MNERIRLLDDWKGMMEGGRREQKIDGKDKEREERRTEEQKSIV